MKDEGERGSERIEGGREAQIDKQGEWRSRVPLTSVTSPSK